MKIKVLARKECANFFEGNCLIARKKCWVSEERCAYFEQAVIPGVNREDHPDYRQYKAAIQRYRDTIQFAGKGSDKDSL